MELKIWVESCGRVSSVSPANDNISPGVMVRLEREEGRKESTCHGEHFKEEK